MGAGREATPSPHSPSVHQSPAGLSLAEPSRQASSPGASARMAQSKGGTGPKGTVVGKWKIQSILIICPVAKISLLPQNQHALRCFCSHLGTWHKAAKNLRPHVPIWGWTGNTLPPCFSSCRKRGSFSGPLAWCWSAVQCSWAREGDVPYRENTCQISSVQAAVNGALGHGFKISESTVCTKWGVFKQKHT